MQLLATIFAVAAIAPSTAMAAELAVGQTRGCVSSNPQQKKLYVTIGRIEPFGGTTAVSVTLFNTNPSAPIPQIAHTPIDAGVLKASCPFVEEDRLPISANFEAGYAEWRQAAHGGVFTIPVDQIYDLIAAQMPKARQEGGLNVH